MRRQIAKTSLLLLMTGILLLPGSWCCAAPMATLSKNHTDISNCCTAKKPNQEQPDTSKTPVNCLCCAGKVFPVSEKTHVIPPPLAISLKESQWEAPPFASGLLGYSKSPAYHSRPLHALLCVWIC